uniref:Uncharacterized protein n=1 Tax=Clytia hemisphaerica TaxID=252671 RepID=A0A7M5X343_9CNID
DFRFRTNIEIYEEMKCISLVYLLFVFIYQTESVYANNRDTEESNNIRQQIYKRLTSAKDYGECCLKVLSCCVLRIPGRKRSILDTMDNEWRKTIRKDLPSKFNILRSIRKREDEIEDAGKTFIRRTRKFPVEERQRQEGLEYLPKLKNIALFLKLNQFDHFMRKSTQKYLHRRNEILKREIVILAQRLIRKLHRSS